MARPLVEAPSGRRGQQTLATFNATALTLTGALPAFMTSALAVQIGVDLHLGPARLGIATSALFVVSACSSRSLGRLVQARGVRLGYVSAAVFSGLALCLVASAPNFTILLVGLAIGGLGNALAQPTANLLVHELVGAGRMGIAISIKQCYIPFASLLGGLTIPTLVVAFGWRWAIWLAAGICALVTLRGIAGVHATTKESIPHTRRSAPTSHGLVLLTIGAGMAAAAATGMGVFLVDAAVREDIQPAHAGYLLAVCSVLMVIARIALGWGIDRGGESHDIVRLISQLLIGSVLGYLLLASGGEWRFAVGAVIAYLGWSWAGLLHLAVVRGNGQAVASATGILQTGLALGAAVGPLSFGVLAENVSYSSAWGATAVVGLGAAVVIRYAGHILAQEQMKLRTSESAHMRERVAPPPREAR